MKAGWRELHLTFSKLFHLNALMQKYRILWRKTKINLADKRYFNKYSTSHQHHVTVYGRPTVTCMLFGEVLCLSLSCQSLADWGPDSARKIFFECLHLVTAPTKGTLDAFSLQISLPPNQLECTGVGRVSLNYSHTEISSAGIKRCRSLTYPSLRVPFYWQAKRTCRSPYKEVILYNMGATLWDLLCLQNYDLLQGEQHSCSSWWEKGRKKKWPGLATDWKKKRHRCIMTLSWKSRD